MLGSAVDAGSRRPGVVLGGTLPTRCGGRGLARILMLKGDEALAAHWQEVPPPPPPGVANTVMHGRGMPAVLMGAGSTAPPAPPTLGTGPGSDVLTLLPEQWLSTESEMACTRGGPRGGGGWHSRPMRCGDEPNSSGVDLRGGDASQFLLELMGIEVDVSERNGCRAA
jgi:hypothetical protein